MSRVGRHRNTEKVPVRLGSCPPTQQLSPQPVGEGEGDVLAALPGQRGDPQRRTVVRAGVCSARPFHACVHGERGPETSEALSNWALPSRAWVTLAHG